MPQEIGWSVEAKLLYQIKQLTKALSSRSYIQTYANFASFPNPGITGTLYVDEATGDIYVWNGTGYVLLSSGITALNGLIAAAQLLVTGTSGTDFNISSVGTTHTFNIPTASAVNRGLLSSADWTTFNSKPSGTGTTNYVSKFTGASTLGNSQIFDNGTNVGIVTASPSYNLDINGTLRSVNDAYFATTSGGVSIGSTSTGGAKLNITNGDFQMSPTYKLILASTTGQIYLRATSGTGDLQMFTNFAERMRITNAGNVGIGTTTPSVLLDVNGETRIRTINNFSGAPTFLLTTDANGVIQKSTTAPVTGSGTTNYVPKFTGSTAVGNSQIFDNGTNVGIGNISPSFLLDVSGQGRYTSTLADVLRILSTNANGGFIALQTSTIAPLLLGFGNTLAASATINEGAIRFASGEALHITEGSTTRALFRGTKLLLNTTTDAGAYALQVNGNGYYVGHIDINASGQTHRITNRYQSGTTGSNIFIGTNATSLSGTTGNQSSLNTSVGISALNVLTTGAQNTAVGQGSLALLTTGDQNNAFGQRALANATTASSNVAVGYQALLNTNANFNTAIGTDAMQANTSGIQNAAFGGISLFSNTTGNFNVAAGMYALRYITTGSNNIGLGYSAGALTASLANNQTSNSSIYIGYDTKSSASGNSNEIVIGHQAVGNGSNTTTIGNSSTTTTIIPAGNVGIGTSSPTQKLYVSGNGIFNAASGNVYTQVESGSNTIALGSDGTKHFIYGTQNIPLDISTNGSPRMRIANNGEVIIDPAGAFTDAGSYVLQAYGSIYNTTGAVFAATSGNVGIGVTSPSQKLDVDGAFRNNGGWIFTGSPSGLGATNRYISGGGSTAIFYFNVPTGGNFTYAVNEVEQMRLNSSGNLGIGTTSPTAALTVSGTNVAAAIDFTNTTVTTGRSFRWVSVNAGGFGIQDMTAGGVDRLRMDLNGNIGIGTTTPSAVTNATGITVNGTDFSFISFYRAGTQIGRLEQNTSSDIQLKTVTSAQLILGTNNTTRVQIYGAGNVRIGSAAADSGQLLQVGGTAQITQDTYLATSSGNVGVGTSSPTSKLDIQYNNSTIYDPNNTNSTNAGVQIQNLTTTSGTAAQITFGIIGTGTGIASISAVHTGALTSDLTFSTRGGSSATPERMRITSTGNVGVGTTNPTPYTATARVLHIDSSNTFSEIKLTNTTTGNTSTAGLLLNIQGNDANIWNGSNGYMGFGTNNSRRMQIFSNGNVRIGSTFSDSGQLFQVDGTFLTTGAWTLGGSPGGAGAAARYISGGGSTNIFYYNVPSGGSHIFAVNETQFLLINSSANIGIRQTTFGTNATNTLAISTGVAPASSPADCFQLYSQDITAGNAAPHFRTENGAVVKVYQETTAVAAATLVSNAGTAITATDTFDGYTLQQIVKALRNQGLLA